MNPATKNNKKRTTDYTDNTDKRRIDAAQNRGRHASLLNVEFPIRVICVIRGLILFLAGLGSYSSPRQERDAGRQSRTISPMRSGSTSHSSRRPITSRLSRVALV